jgi:hypothetical protein
MKYWVWKSQVIDFSKLSKETIGHNCSYEPTKAEWIFHYLGIPDEKVHKWVNGSYSCEYNTALDYAYELGLVVDSEED